MPGTGTSRESEQVRVLASLFYEDNDVITLLFLNFLNTHQFENELKAMLMFTSNFYCLHSDIYFTFSLSA